MRFNKVSITNMRLVGGETRVISFDHQKNVAILLGDNGCGKTTVLDALATVMAPYPAQFPGIQDFQLSDLDVHIDSNGKRTKYLVVDSILEDDGKEIISIRYRKGTHTTPKANYEQLKQLAIKHKENIIEGENNVNLPVFAYYGTGRGQFKVPERKRGFQQTFERWDCYRSAINPETDFKRFFGWYDLMEDDERREKLKRSDFSYKSPVLEAVRKALSEFVGIHYKNPRIETRPLRFVIDKVDSSGSKQELRIEQLSDGYKIVIAMVADLAARMAEANPNIANPLEGNGIVLIDEIDLHLHPNWQRKIIKQLTAVFKNVQFIVSTHSPIIVIGGSDIAQVINLNNAKNEENEDISYSNIGSILLSELFGLDSLQSPKWDDKIKERDLLLSKPQLDEQDELRLAELDKEMRGLTSIESSTVIRSNMLLEKLAKELNIEI